MRLDEKKLNIFTESDIIKDLSEYFKMDKEYIKKVYDLFIEYLDKVVYDEIDSSVIRIPSIGEMVLSLPKLSNKVANKDYSKDWLDRKKLHIYANIDTENTNISHDYHPATFSQGLGKENKIRRYDVYGRKPVPLRSENSDLRNLLGSFSPQELEYIQAKKFFKEDLEYRDRKDLKERYIRVPKDVFETEEDIPSEIIDEM